MVRAACYRADMLKNLYIRRGDETFWKRAQEAADARGVALSVWISDLIRVHFYEVGAKRKVEPTVDELLADIETKTARVQELLAARGESAS